MQSNVYTCLHDNVCYSTASAMQCPFVSLSEFLPPYAAATLGKGGQWWAKQLPRILLAQDQVECRPHHAYAFMHLKNEAMDHVLLCKPGSKVMLEE